MSATITGGWTAYTTELSNDVKAVFAEATKGLLGVDYTPLAVATQVVSGTNYRFFCNMKAVYPNALNEAAILQIYKPTDGSVHITAITKVPQ
jgi:hypothetical protein